MEQIPSADSMRQKTIEYSNKTLYEKKMYIIKTISDAASLGKRRTQIGLRKSGNSITGYNVDEYVEELRSLGYTVVSNEDFFFSGYNIEW